ncbi:MAG TPA: twin transmembrane helix small protein [Macromonas sp.]|nr:twin transmembrane helix small protein [Macromonas sp.]
MKYVIVLAFLAILGSLAAAGVFMLKRDPNATGNAASKRMARALAWRVGLSMLLFLLVILAYQLGWLHPSGVPLR